MFCVRWSVSLSEGAPIQSIPSRAMLVDAGVPGYVGYAPEYPSFAAQAPSLSVCPALVLSGNPNLGPPVELVLPGVVFS